MPRLFSLYLHFLNNSNIGFYIFTSFGFYIFTSFGFYILTSFGFYIFTSYGFLNFCTLHFPLLSFLLWFLLLSLKFLILAMVWIPKFPKLPLRFSWNTGKISFYLFIKKYDIFNEIIIVVNSKIFDLILDVWLRPTLGTGTRNQEQQISINKNLWNINV